MGFTQQPLEIPPALPFMSSKQHDELESEMTGFLSALPAKLICEIALRCPIRSFRGVVRFDVQSVACTRIQRWYRSWSLNTSSQKSEARAANVCSATPTCRAEGTTPPTSLPSAFLPFKVDGKCLPDAASWLEHGCDVLRARACGPVPVPLRFGGFAKRARRRVPQDVCLCVVNCEQARRGADQTHTVWGMAYVQYVLESNPSNVHSPHANMQHP